MHAPRQVRQERELKQAQRKWRAHFDPLRRMLGLASDVLPEGGKTELQQELEIETRSLDAMHPGLEQVRAALLHRKQELVRMLAKDESESTEMCLVIDEKVASPRPSVLAFALALARACALPAPVRVPALDCCVLRLLTTWVQ